MTDVQRKIELQSAEDLQYLLGNVRRGAREKIDQALPPMEGDGEDSMRKKVEEDVGNYVNKVFLAMAPNITINGLSPDHDLMTSILSSTTSTSNGVIEEHEPFNHNLFEKGKDNARQEEESIEDIARLRRTAPGNIVEKTKKRFKEEAEADDEGLKGIDEKMGEKEVLARNGAGGVLGVGKLERQEEMEASWLRGVKGLEKVMKTMPEVVARCERAGKAEEHINGMDGK